MKNEFYKYVKNKIQSIPCSGYFDFSLNHFVLEESFVNHINEKYLLTPINFQQNSIYFCFPPTIRDEQKIEDTIIYNFKVNNQLYFEYKAFNTNTIESDKYCILNLVAYSSETNQKELVSFLEYIGEYIKNNK